MRFLLTGIRALMVLLITAFQMTLLAVESLICGKTEERGFKHRRRWAKKCTWALGIKLDEVSGSFEIPQALIVANHRTLLDPVIMANYLDAYIIAKAEVASLPLIAQGAEMTGIVFVKRENLRSRLAARDTAKVLLQSGKNVLVYAEGTTGTNQTSDTFKPGTFMLASELGIPVIPVSIEYKEERDLWYEGGLGTQMLRQIGKWRTHAKLRIHPPMQGANGKQLTKDVQAVIDQGLIEMQRDWSDVFSTD